MPQCHDLAGASSVGDRHERRSQIGDSTAAKSGTPPFCRR
jgi:hypothetical protein